MDESELTRKAIEEIMREMNAQKEADEMPQMRERKLNPLGRPNKDFLDRTINSVMSHNKRQLERNYRKCQSKLKAMDRAKDSYEESRRRGRDRHRSRVKIKRKRRYTESTSTSSRDSSSASSRERKSKPKKTKKKKKRSKKQTRSKSSSSKSSSSSSLSLQTRTPSPQHSHENFKVENSEVHQDLYDDPTSFGYYVDPNMAMAAMAYSHMNQMMQQQQQQTIQDMLKAELENDEEDTNEKDDAIPSDLSLNYHSAESEINVSLNTSSAEEDANGILTFKVTSDEEKPQNQIKKVKRKRKVLPKSKQKLNKNHPSKDQDALPHLESTSDSERSINIGTITKDEVTVISSSSRSESEENLKRTNEEITTILSSCSSTESEEEETDKPHQQHITILSSSSSSLSCEEEIENEKLTTNIKNMVTNEKASILKNLDEMNNQVLEECNGNKVPEDPNKITTDISHCSIDLTSSDNQEVEKSLRESSEKDDKYLNEVNLLKSGSKYEEETETIEFSENYKNDEVEKSPADQSILREQKYPKDLNAESLIENNLEPTESLGEQIKETSKDIEEGFVRQLSTSISKEPEISEIAKEIDTGNILEEDETPRNDKETPLSNNNKEKKSEVGEKVLESCEINDAPENVDDIIHTEKEEKTRITDKTTDLASFKEVDLGPADAENSQVSKKPKIPEFEEPTIKITEIQKTENEKS